ncbi:MAG: PAS-domain containing protein, partial [Pseudomonadota bacterium]
MIAALAFLLSSLPAFAKVELASAMPHNVIIGVLLAGMVAFGAFCAILLSYSHKQAAKIEATAQCDIHAMAQRLALSEMLSRFDEQVVLFWEKTGPVDLTASAPSRLKYVPLQPEKLLAFSEWLEEASASELSHRMKTFLEVQETFTQAAQTMTGTTLEIEARLSPSGPMLRIRALSDIRAQSVQLADQLTKAVRELETLRSVLNEIPVPLWMRTTSGQLSWVNKAYAAAVDAADTQQAIKQGFELLDQAARQKAVEALGNHGIWQSQMLRIANGQRRNLNILLRANGMIEAGCAVEATDNDFTLREVGRVTEAHQRTLDHLATAVAIFGADRKLVYYNPAWQKLWGFDPAYLDEKPEEGAILDRLREQRKLPEQADYKSWKAQHLESYISNEAREVWWHAPDGRTLRVYTHPNPQGGITLVQENVTEVLDLKSRAAAYERMQHETLDALTDAVAVFGSDGRLQLNNPALLKLWQFDKEFIAKNPHIDELIAKGMTRYANPVVWAEL